MKYVLTSIFIVAVGFLFTPVFALAGYDCYVDSEADSGGDGSEDEPYQKISKALSESCKDIYVAAGSYNDNIVLGKDVKIKGKGSADVSITGLVEMEYGSEIADVEIKGKGVKVKSGASVKLVSVYVRDATTGIETVDGGTLTVKNSKINKNGKGFYIQKGKDISITSSEISGNIEEGIDIRSNVDGLVSGNVIEDNGESGIEVILGKSEIVISNNKIKGNGSSGIAAQFYDIADKLGSINVTGNTLSGNSNYGIDCKKPSGGSPERDYWSESMTIIGNQISSNKKGDLSASCKLSDDEIANSTKTKEEIAAAVVAEEAAKIAKEQALVEEARLAKEKEQEEEVLALKEQEEREAQAVAALLEEEKRLQEEKEAAEKASLKAKEEEEAVAAAEKWRIFGEILGAIVAVVLLGGLFLSKNFRKKSIFSPEINKRIL